MVRERRAYPSLRAVSAFEYSSLAGNTIRKRTRGRERLALQMTWRVKPGKMACWASFVHKDPHETRIETHRTQATFIEHIGQRRRAASNRIRVSRHPWVAQTDPQRALNRRLLEVSNPKAESFAARDRSTGAGFGAARAKMRANLSCNRHRRHHRRSANGEKPYRRPDG